LFTENVGKTWKNPSFQGVHHDFQRQHLIGIVVGQGLIAADISGPSKKPTPKTKEIIAVSPWVFPSSNKNMVNKCQ
jgi:hypothetical protein